jgi:hypothetical protein
MRRKCINLCFLILLLVSIQSFAQKTSEHYSSLPLRKSSGEHMATLVNINNMSMWVQADGVSGHNPHTNNWGVIYPRGTAGVVYADGIVWGGLVRDGITIWDCLIRVGGSTYASGLRPGRIVTKGVAEDPGDTGICIWRIRPDWQKADLTQDAAEFFNVSVDSITKEQIDALRVQYEKDWKEWPWQKGAPFYDANSNGIMDSDEEPGLAYADQVVWFVANDMDSVVTEEFLGSPPIGLEMQVTLWAYNRTGYQSNEVLSNLNEALQHIIFKRVRLIYKGYSNTPDTARIDSMYIGQWSDPNVGNAGDDLVGCDTLLNMGYVYNGYETDNEYIKYDIPPAAAGYCFLVGPTIPSPGDSALFDLRFKHNYKNLPMTSFAWFVEATAIEPPQGYENTLLWYKMLRGYVPSYGRDDFYPFSPGVEPNSFPLSGDPVTCTGFIDGMGEMYSFAPGDRRFICSSGPFTMSLGDTQEVIIAIVGGLGSDRLASISVMKHFARWTRSHTPYIFEMGFQEEGEPQSKEEPLLHYFRLYQNYPNPFNARTEIRYDLPVQKNVKLTIYNLLGQVVRVLVNEKQDAKSYVIKWDGTDVLGEKVPTGIYLYRIDAGYWVLTRKMMLIQ